MTSPLTDTIDISMTFGSVITLDITGATDANGADEGGPLTSLDSSAALTGASVDQLAFGTVTIACASAPAGTQCVKNGDTTGGAAIVVALQAEVNFAGFTSCAFGIMRNTGTNFDANDLRVGTTSTDWRTFDTGTNVTTTNTTITGCNAMTSGGTCPHELSAQFSGNDGTGAASTQVTYTVTCT